MALNLENELVRIRSLRAEDEDTYCEILADLRVSSTLRGSITPDGPLKLLCDLTAAERVEKFRNTLRIRIDGKLCHFAAEDRQSGQLIGSIGSYDIDRNRLGLSYWIASPFHGRGFGSALLGLYCRPALVYFGRYCIIANVALDNPASAAAVQKAGFKASRFSDDPGFGLNRGRQLFEFSRDDTEAAPE